MTVPSPQRCLDVLAEQALLPAAYEAVYLAGSLVRGWGNPSSDIDVYVVVPRPWTGQPDGLGTVSVAPGAVPVRGFTADGRRWDVEFWTDEQVDALLELVSWESFEAGRARGDALTLHEVAFMQRLGYARVVRGAGWLARRVDQFDGSAVRAMIGSRALYELDLFTDDAVGMLAAGDVDSAVLAARCAFGHAVEALLASHGEFNEQPKWRARRMRDVAPAELGFADYWAVETMRDLDPAAPEKWVEHVLRVCQQIANEVTL
jgi:hypothetical protein